MGNDNNMKKEGTLPSPLEELLKSAESDAERESLRRGWEALNELDQSGQECIGAPKPCAELERIFRGGDGRLSDDDLEMIAAAGTQVGNNNNDFLMGGGGDDVLDGRGGNDYMFGYGGDDTMYGGSGNDYMVGGSGNDFISGGDGNDCLVGGDGNDIIDGGTGDDRLIGGAGDDTLTGGEGSDTFLFSHASGNDTVTDFQVGIDTISLAGVNSMDDFSVNNASGDTVITIGDSVITLVGVSLTAEEIWAMQEN